MSIAGLATLGAVRDAKPPDKSDVGKEPSAGTLSNLDIAITAIPTGAITIYTTWIALVAAQVKEAAEDDPTPNLYEPFRWLGFALLLLVTAGLLLKGYKDKGGTRKTPTSELLVGLVAAAGWGLGMPESPLVPRLGDSYGPLVPGSSPWSPPVSCWCSHSRSRARRSGAVRSRSLAGRRRPLGDA